MHCIIMWDMKFVDRIDEAARLKDALAREKSSLVVMYGRRRLGKSTLIKRVLSENDVYFLADRSEEQHQRVLLAKVIAQIFPDFDKLTYPDWESMFRAVNYRTDKRFTLCLDEFPYLVEQSPELPSVLQKLVDEKLLKYNLVLCGSSQNMMYGLFLDSTAPLYGRADEIMKLAPIRLPYIQEALSLDAMNAIEEYAVWGGVPRYWELRENRISLDDAMWHNILSVNGTLYEEPVKLFQDDVKDIVKTSTIMSYIGTGANRLSEIAARCNEPATNLSRPLKLFAFSLIFFRLESVSDALYYIRNISFSTHASWKEVSIGIPDHNCIVAGSALVLILVYEYIMSKRDLLEALEKQPMLVRWGIYYLLAIMFFTLGQFNSDSFIYLQF